MSVKAMDKVLSKWFLSSEFRDQMNVDPDRTLLEFDLTADEHERLVNTLCRKRRKANMKHKMAPIKRRIAFTPTNRVQFVRPTKFGYSFSRN